MSKTVWFGPVLDVGWAWVTSSTGPISWVELEQWPAASAGCRGVVECRSRLKVKYQSSILAELQRTNGTCRPTDPERPAGVESLFKVQVTRVDFLWMGEQRHEIFKHNITWECWTYWLTCSRHFEGEGGRMSSLFLNKMTKCLRLIVGPQSRSGPNLLLRVLKFCLSVSNWHSFYSIRMAQERHRPISHGVL